MVLYRLLISVVWGCIYPKIRSICRFCPHDERFIPVVLFGIVFLSHMHRQHPHEHHRHVSPTRANVFRTILPERSDGRLEKFPDVQY